MKKIFTVALLFFVCAGYGQSLRLIFDGQNYNDNDTATIVVGHPGGDNDYYIDVANLSDSVVDLMVRKTELYVVPGTGNVFCFGSQCYSGNQSSESVTVQPGDTFSHSNYPANAFHIIYSPDNNLGTTIIKYTFFDQNDTAIASGLILKFVTTSSLQDYTSSLSLLAYPNPAVSNVTIKYDMGKSDFSSAELVVKNFMGVTLYSKQLIQNSDRIMIDLSDFSPGIYFYSIQQRGKTVLTKKLLVK
jgi:hypothetical protein